MRFVMVDRALRVKNIRFEKENRTSKHPPRDKSLHDM
jgi:hypothetical protein